MMTTWIFVITLAMTIPGAGVDPQPVLARIETLDLKACTGFRNLVMKQMGITSEATNVQKNDATKAIVTKCEEWTR
jgi:hypothetical protein